MEKTRNFSAIFLFSEAERKEKGKLAAKENMGNGKITNQREMHEKQLKNQRIIADL